jgi:hypothetical protein
VKASTVSIHTDIYASSATTTKAVGYFSGHTFTTPTIALNPASYSDEGKWRNAAEVASSLWIDPSHTYGALSDASWVSSAATVEGGFEDQWRLFKETITIPPQASDISAFVSISADDAFAVYLDDISSLVVRNGFVFETAPSPQPEYYKGFWGLWDFAPPIGKSDLYFVVRNWTSIVYNPTGLLYEVTVNYSSGRQ